MPVIIKNINDQSKQLRLFVQIHYCWRFKYVVYKGDVGKSCLLSRFIDGRFKDDLEPTLGVEFASKIIDTQGNNIKIQIWDTVIVA